MSNSDGTPSPRRWWLRRLLNRMEIDRATFFALLLRAWQLSGGAVTMVLIAVFFSPELQGYYFTFASLLGWQTIFELGFSTSTTNVSSHEWERLKLDDTGRIVGDRAALARLASLAGFIAKWFAAATLVFVVVIGVAGGWVLGQQGGNVEWQMPWLWMLGLTALLSWLLPLNALLEGCNQVATVNRYRFVQAVAGSGLMWAGFVLGWDLWVPVAGVAARLAINVLLVAVRYRRFWSSLRQSTLDQAMDWRREVWPLQWRLAVQGLTAFCLVHLFNPVMFHYHGAVVAGQMGMTWNIVTVIQAAALAWVHTRVPLFGMLIARRDFVELDRVYRRLTIVSLVALTLGSAALLGMVQAIYVFSPGYLAGRLLGPLPTAVLLGGIILFHVPQCQALYLRAHKRDPLLLLSTLSNTGIGLSILLLGGRFGPIGAAWGYLAVIGLFTLPATTWIWQRCRREWHEVESTRGDV